MIEHTIVTIAFAHTQNKMIVSYTHVKKRVVIEHTEIVLNLPKEILFLHSTHPKRLFAQHAHTQVF
jgi:hypothetical protein